MEIVILTGIGDQEDIVDGDKDQLHKKTNESHDCESNSARSCDFDVLLSVGFRAPRKESPAVFHKILGTCDHRADCSLFFRHLLHVELPFWCGD